MACKSTLFLACGDKFLKSTYSRKFQDNAQAPFQLKLGKDRFLKLGLQLLGLLTLKISTSPWNVFQSLQPSSRIVARNQ
jgi:hypothetical protein